MQKAQLPSNILDVLTNISYANIATVCDNGEPWNTPLYVQFDEHMNMYWASWKQNHHSKNIRKRPHIFVTVYDSSGKVSDGNGLYLQMAAEELTNSIEIAQALGEYKSSIDCDSPEIFMGKNPRRLYKAKPLAIWQNTDSDLKGRFIDIRQKLF